MLEQVRIAMNPTICGGRAHGSGTRLTVEFLLQLFEVEWTEDTILEYYRKSTSDEVRAVFALARSTIARESFAYSLAESTRTMHRHPDESIARSTVRALQ